MSDVTSTFDTLKFFTNQMINFLPLGLYFFSYFTAVVFKDMRGAILILGLFLNDLIGIFNNKYLGDVQPNPNCGIFRNLNGEIYELPNKHTEVITFFSSFFYAEMFNKKKTDWFKFIFLLLMILLTIWSRMNVGCESNMKIIIFAIMSGLIRGILFYYVFSNQWSDLSEDKNKENKKVDCKYETDNYSCETIKNGKLIVKRDSSDETNN